MKILIAFFAIIALVLGAPWTISDNNIGDIAYVSVHANGVVSTNLEANLAAFIAAYKNQQVALVNDGDLPISPTNSEIAPELISEVKNIDISPDMIEAVKKAFLKE